jgi:hypothetical protein
LPILAMAEPDEHFDNREVLAIAVAHCAEALSGAMSSMSD